MKTFDEWYDSFDVLYRPQHKDMLSEFGGTYRIVYSDHPGLWDLTDYAVSSAQSGLVHLVKRSEKKISDMEWEKIWQHFNRMQLRIMDDITTKEQFFSESEESRLEFYNWMQDQCGQYACFM